LKDAWRKPWRANMSLAKHAASVGRRGIVSLVEADVQFGLSRVQRAAEKVPCALFRVRDLFVDMPKFN